MTLGGSRDRHDPRLLRQQPGQGDLRRRHALALRYLPQHAHQRLIGPARFGAEARHHVAKIAAVKGGVLGDGAGEKALAERAEWHQTDAQRCQRRQDFTLRLAPPQRIFALQRRDRLHRVSSPNGLRTGFRQAEILHFPFANQLLHRTGHLLDRHLGIDTVLIQQIDRLHPQALQRTFHRLANMLRTAVQHLLPRRLRQVETELGGDDDPIAHRRQRFAQQFLVRERTVNLRGIEERHAFVDRGADQIDRLPFIGGRAVAKAQSHTAQPQRRDFQPFAPQFACLHLHSPTD